MADLNHSLDQQRILTAAATFVHEARSAGYGPDMAGPLLVSDILYPFGPRLGKWTLRLEMVSEVGGTESKVHVG